ncbi:RNA N(6)-adenosine-methyltransferase mettl16-like isoform X2 [Lycorma delicatula]|uniref:RNA N(6)-adenosine-methyltransferase mettl16-like isoform X2 n=1 Tax=Lycorma delicatula TaxID=130591 RepID=UPI003F51AC28
MGKKKKENHVHPPLKQPHPRNIYKRLPDFKELALKFPEFRKFAKTNLDGKVTMDFKDKEALSMLTKILLKKDFGLDVDLPSDRLVPTVPLRLNYVLWIEDLLANLPPKLKSSDIHGIDIGTGASCIYALLAARKNNWYMLATEIDEINFEYADQNVAMNSLHDFIKDSLSMNGKTKDRSGHRLPPKNAHTGSSAELIASGGEVAFIKNIIKDSIKLKDRVKIYSTMVGHKSNVDKLRSELVELVGEEHMTLTSFNQGHVTRWGIAWTLNKDIKLLNCGEKSFSSKKTKPPLEYTHHDITLDSAVDRVRFLLERIKIDKRVIQKSSYEYAMELTAYEETWKNQRKRRRAEEREMKEVKRLKTEETNENHNNCKNNDIPQTEVNMYCDIQPEIHKTADINNRAPHKSTTNEPNPSDVNKNNICPSTVKDITTVVVINEEKNKVLSAIIILKVSDNKKDVVIQMSSIGGTGGWQSVHQLICYLKSNWDRQLKPNIG